MENYFLKKISVFHIEYNEKNNEEIPLCGLNFEWGPTAPLLSFEGGPRISGSRGPRSRGPGPTFTPCQFKSISEKRLLQIANKNMPYMLIDLRKINPLMLG